MEKEILKRGYVTHALTNEDDEIYGIIEDRGVNWKLHIEKQLHRFYWSEVYVELGENTGLYRIIRKGTLLVDATPEELAEKFEQSIVNLHP